MSKRWILILSVLAFPAMARAAFPPVQEMGSVSASTSVAIAVSTTPTIVLSTGTNMAYGKQLGDAANWTLPAISSFTIPGQYMVGRTRIEFFNDTSTDVWIGYNTSVSTIPGANYGRRIPIGTGLSLTGDIRGIFVVQGSTWTSAPFPNEKKFVITQSK